MFKTLVLSALYNLSDDQIDYQVRDRLSFMRFLGLGLEDRVPDAKTVWLYREGLAQAGLVEELFRQFDGHLARRGYIARGGHRASCGPRKHNTREENKTIKILDKPVQKDTVAARQEPLRYKNAWIASTSWSGAITSATPPCTTARRWITC